MNSWAMGRPTGRDDFEFSRFRTGVGDVFGNGGGKQDWFLEYDRKLSAQVRQPILAQVNSVQQDSSLGRIVKTR